MNRRRIVERAEGVHRGEVDAGDGERPRPRAAGDHERPVRNRLAAGEADRVRIRVDRLDTRLEPQLDQELLVLLAASGRSASSGGISPRRMNFESGGRL